jgi:hypothetical protein
VTVAVRTRPTFPTVTVKMGVAVKPPAIAFALVLNMFVAVVCATVVLCAIIDGVTAAIAAASAAASSCDCLRRAWV